jgi:hypothetical protein
MTQTCWTIPDNALVDLTPLRARELLVECFFQAQRETFARTRQKLGSSRIDDTTLRADIVGAVRLAFKETGGDFEHPDAASLASAVGVLARKAGSWGTPQDIIEHHGASIQKMLQRLARP